MNSEDVFMGSLVVGFVILIGAVLAVCSHSESMRIAAVQQCIEQGQKPLECKAAYGLE